MIWAFLAPMIALIILDPAAMVPSMIFIAGFVAASLWVADLLIGKKET